MSLYQKLTLYMIVVVCVIAIGSIFAYLIGLSGGFNIPHLNLLNSIYYTVDTLTTNSYGDIIPVSEIAKIFTVLTELAGVSIFIGALTILSTDIMESKVDKLSGDISDAEARLLRNHVVLIGTNSVNMYLAKQLKISKKRFVMLTNNKQHLEELKDLGYPVHLTNITSKQAMMRYGVEYADRIVIDIREDRPLSVYTLLVAKSLVGKDTEITVVARDEDTESYLMDMAKGKNVHVVNPEYDVAKELMGKN